MGRIVFEGRSYPTVFRAATWAKAEDLAVLARKVLEDLGYDFERRTTSKNFSKTVFVVPMPKFAYVYEFNVKDPAEFTLQLYDKSPTQSGVLHMVEIKGITEDNLPSVKGFITSFAAGMPKKPWKFGFSQRFRYGLLAPEYVTAKRKWRRWGVK